MFPLLSLPLRTSALVASIALLTIVVAAAPTTTSIAGYTDPTKLGNGSWFLDAGNGLGEPLNVVISGESSPAVLTDTGLLNYARSFNFSSECFGKHLGTSFTADLGDGAGAVDQVAVIRQDYANADIGTCFETLLGGNHFRVFRQNGTANPTGALFLAVSYEQPLSEHHTISEDGYNKGRDDLVKAATGTTVFGGVTYQTTAELMSGVMPAGIEKVNHDIAVDGNAYLLTVSIIADQDSS